MHIIIEQAMVTATDAHPIQQLRRGCGSSPPPRPDHHGTIEPMRKADDAKSPRIERAPDREHMDRQRPVPLGSMTARSHDSVRVGHFGIFVVLAREPAKWSASMDGETCWPTRAGKRATHRRAVDSNAVRVRSMIRMTVAPGNSITVGWKGCVEWDNASAAVGQGWSNMCAPESGG